MNNKQHNTCITKKKRFLFIDVSEREPRYLLEHMSPHFEEFSFLYCFLHMINIGLFLRHPLFDEFLPELFENGRAFGSQISFSSLAWG